MIATSRDRKLFAKILFADMVYLDAEIYGSFVGLTKKSGKELTERNFSSEETKLFDEAKMVEIANLENGNALSSWRTNRRRTVCVLKSFTGEFRQDSC